MIIIVENIDMFIKGLAIKLKAHLFSDNRVSTISAKHVIIKVIIGIIFKFNNHIIADIFHRNYLNSLLNEDILLIKFFLQQLLSASLRIDVEVGKFCFIVEETGDLVINKNFWSSAYFEVGKLDGFLNYFLLNRVAIEERECSWIYQQCPRFEQRIRFLSFIHDRELYIWVWTHKHCRW